jgi:hypothetical protein
MGESKMADRSTTPFEGGIQSRVIKRLNVDPWTLVRCRSADAVGHVVGDPDVSGTIGGWHVEIELKKGDNVPSPKQWYELRKWASRRAYCAVVYTLDQALAFQQEVLAERGQGCILVFGKALEQVRQGTHFGGKQVTFATIGSGGGYETVVEGAL